jgi:hypothetical protein
VCLYSFVLLAFAVKLALMREYYSVLDIERSRQEDALAARLAGGWHTSFCICFSISGDRVHFALFNTQFFVLTCFVFVLRVQLGRPRNRWRSRRPAVRTVAMRAGYR